LLSQNVIPHARNSTDMHVILTGLWRLEPSRFVMLYPKCSSWSSRARQPL